MKNLEIIIVGLLLTIGALVGFGYLWRYANPGPAEIAGSASTIQIPPKDILKSETFDKLGEYNLNGPLPVTLNKDDFGREDPFAKY